MGRVPRGPARLAGVAPEEGAGHRPGGGPGGVAQEDQGVVRLVVETEPAGRQLVPPAQWVITVQGRKRWRSQSGLSFSFSFSAINFQQKTSSNQFPAINCQQ